MKKRLLNIMLALSICYGCLGCTHRAWYEGFNQEQRRNCQNLPTREQQECLDKASMTYDQYKTEREKRIIQDK